MNYEDFTDALIGKLQEQVPERRLTQLIVALQQREVRLTARYLVIRKRVTNYAKPYIVNYLDCTCFDTLADVKERGELWLNTAKNVPTDEHEIEVYDLLTLKEQRFSVIKKMEWYID